MSIYDDVAALQTQMTAAETAITALQSSIAPMVVQTLAAGADLDALGVGKYILPDATVAASILNKPPTANTATTYIEVVEGGGAGQLMMYYHPCAKEGASYFQRSYYGGSWGDWNDINVFDSGWLDMTLSGSVIAFNEEQKPRYRRIGKEVFISGVVKNIEAVNTVIATLPANYRPSKKIIIAVPSTGTKFSRVSIQTNGVITFEQSSDNAIAASNWVSIACNFAI